MNVSACLVTRGDVDMQPVLDSLPPEWEQVVWDNSVGCMVGPKGYISWRDGKPFVEGEGRMWFPNNPDLSVYGRYAAIEYASHDLIYVQDDDVIVSDPQAIVDVWHEVIAKSLTDEEAAGEFLVANMPQEFRHDGYTDSCLVGWGSVFDAHLATFAFLRWQAAGHPITDRAFLRDCDVVFTTLVPHRKVDVGFHHLPWAEDPARALFLEPDHARVRAEILAQARAVRDGESS